MLYVSILEIFYDDGRQELCLMDEPATHLFIPAHGEMTENRKRKD